MRKFFFSIALAMLLAGTAAVSSAEARWHRGYYARPAYSYYYAPGYYYYGPSYYYPAYGYYGIWR